jgi:hypothetical protein
MSDGADDRLARLEEALGAFGERLEAIEKQLGLIRRDLASQRTMVESAVAAIEQMDRRFDAPEI